MRIRHILIASDLSGDHDAVYELALGLAKPWGARVSLLHVQKPTQFSTRHLLSASRSVSANGDGTDRLRRDVERLSRAGPGLAVETALRAGDPADEICAYAAENEVDLVVIGRSKSAPVSHLWLGRTLRGVLAGMAAPILVVPHTRGALVETDPKRDCGSLRPRTPHGILGLTDLSSMSRVGLQIVADLARSFHAYLECLHVVQLRPALFASDKHWPMMLASETPEELMYTIRPDPFPLRDRNQEADAVPAAWPPTITIGTSISHAVEAAARQRDFDLVAMMADDGRSHVGRQRFRLHTGHVARAVLEHATLPVLILPAPFVAAVENGVFSDRADESASARTTLATFRPSFRGKDCVGEADRRTEASS